MAHSNVCCKSVRETSKKKLQRDIVKYDVEDLVNQALQISPAVISNKLRGRYTGRSEIDYHSDMRKEDLSYEVKRYKK